MKNAEYWKKRFELLEQKQNQIGVQCFSDIEKQFMQAQKQLEGQLSAWYQRFADNNGISMQEARKWLTAAELEEFKWDVNQYIRYGKENAVNGQWVKQLENASARYHISRLEALKLQTQQSIETLFGNQLDSIDKTMKNVYRSGYYHTAFEIQKGFGVGWDFAALDDKQIAKVINTPWAVDGKNFSERVWNNRTKLINELNTELTRNIITSSDPQKAIDAIARKMNASKKAAGKLVMTEEAFFSSAAQKDCFAELDVEQFEIVATLDSHTSEICQGMDGEHFKMSEWEVGVTAPPFHPWCRSTTVPYFDDDLGSIGERAAKGEDGKTYYVPANMTYKEWEKSFVGGGDKSELKEIKPDDKMKTKTVDDCSTVEEVQELFKQQGWFYKTTINGETFDGNEKVNLDGIDIGSAKSLFKQHKKLFERYPQLKGKFNATCAAQLSSNAEAQCFYGLGHGGVTVNTKFFGDSKKYAQTYEKEVTSKWSPQGTTWESTIMHEMGHAIDDYLSHVEMVAGISRGKAKKLSSLLRAKVMKACGFTVSDCYNEVSGYSTQDAQEWFAECFAEYMDSPEPRSVAAKFGEMLEEYLKEVK